MHGISILISIYLSHTSTHGISNHIFHMNLRMAFENILFISFICMTFKAYFHSISVSGKNVKYIYILKTKLPTHRYVVETKPPSLAQSHPSSEYVSLYVKFLINLV